MCCIVGNAHLQSAAKALTLGAVGLAIRRTGAAKDDVDEAGSRNLSSALLFSAVHLLREPVPSAWHPLAPSHRMSAGTYDRARKCSPPLQGGVEHTPAFQLSSYPAKYLFQHAGLVRLMSGLRHSLPDALGLRGVRAECDPRSCACCVTAEKPGKPPTRAW